MGFEGIPPMARPTFRYEFISSVLICLGSGPLVQELTQFFIGKRLAAESFFIALLTTEAAAGNFLGAFFSRWLHGRPKVRYAWMSRAAIAVVMLAIALLPAGPSSAAPYAALLAIPAVLGGLVLNVQSGIWHSNYPPAVRGRIFSRLIVWRGIFSVLSIKLSSMALDRWDWGHHLIYAVGAIFTFAGALVFARIRVRGESFRAEQETLPPPLLEGFRILWTDKAYGRYMLWQMVSGSAVLMSLPVVVTALIEKFHVSIDTGTSLASILPAVLELSFVPLAGMLFDRMTIMHYRTVNTLLWAGSRFLLLGALMWQSMVALVAGFTLQGLASSTGGVVWNIGHTRFASPERSQLYMGIHMTLTGIRGLTMPFLGIWLYSHTPVGNWLLGISGAIQAVAALEFFLSEPPSNEPHTNTH